MTLLEKKMVLLLQELHDMYGVVEVKAEFEAEATRKDELMRLKEIAEKAGLGLVLKIGGAEAITDMFEAQHAGVSGLIAPMVESSYAMRKYLEAIAKYFQDDQKKEIHFGVNIETIMAYKNLKDILALDMINIIDTITLGRVDMCGSLGLLRSDIDSQTMYEIAEDVFFQAKKKRLRTTMGGGIEIQSIPFIKKLTAKKLLDRFETRKIVFKIPANFRKVASGILKAHQFELLWLENKRNYYSFIFHEDDKRIDMLKKRINRE